LVIRLTPPEGTYLTCDQHLEPGSTAPGHEAGVNVPTAGAIGQAVDEKSEYAERRLKRPDLSPAGVHNWSGASTDKFINY
jgi:hypothetical protein